MLLLSGAMVGRAAGLSPCTCLGRHVRPACGWPVLTAPVTGCRPRSRGAASPTGAADALAVADQLDITRFIIVGVSTGGAYALAVASVAPDRVLGAVACCAVTDMRCAEARATMSRPHCQTVWDAPDRTAALAAAVEAHGAHGEKLLGGGMATALAPSDAALFEDPEWMATAMMEFPAMFAQGLEGYTDDRIADGVGWSSFDVARIGCPVTVLHGGADRIVHVTHARHTATLVPGARLTVIDELGHFSIIPRIIPTIVQVLASRPGASARENE